MIPPLSRSIRLTHSAFTLIELLVVIAIISILASILFPVFAKAREKARQTACLANTKQLSSAFLMYVQDYDEAFPGSGQATTATGPCVTTPGPGWVAAQQLGMTTGQCAASTLPVPNGSLYSYVKNTQVYRCPSDAVGDDKTLSFSMNGALSQQPLSLIDQSARVPLLLEEASTQDAGLNDGHFQPPITVTGDVMGTRHNEGANFAFTDGHSKWHKPEQIKSAWYQPDYRGE